MSKKKKVSTKMVYSNIVSIILMIVFLYTILPFGVAAANKEFVFDRIANEGYVAFIVNEDTLKENDNDEDDEVKCDGSGYITHGDGHKTPCPGCSECQKSLLATESAPTTDAPIDTLTGRAIVDYVDKSKEEIKEMILLNREMMNEVSGMKDEVEDLRDEVKENAKYIEDLIISEPVTGNWDVPKNGIDPQDMIESISIKPEELKNMALDSKQIAMFGAEWCGPCRKFKYEEADKLRKAGWKVGTGPESQIRLVNIDEDRATYQKWARASGTNSIPLFVLVKKGSFIGYKTGFKTGVQIAEWYNAN